MAEGIRIGGGGKKSGAYVWKKLTAQGGDFIDFVVSDNGVEYPDGGEQGGYWYEKVVEGKAGIDYGTVTLSSAQKTVTVEHNLGASPSHAFLIPVNGRLNAAANYTHLKLDEWYYFYYNSTIWGYSGRYNEFPDNKTIKFVTHATNYPFKAGEYYWIAIA